MIDLGTKQYPEYEEDDFETEIEEEDDEVEGDDYRVILEAYSEAQHQAYLATEDSDEGFEFLVGFSQELDDNYIGDASCFTVEALYEGSRYMSVEISMAAVMANGPEILSDALEFVGAVPQ